MNNSVLSLVLALITFNSNADVKIKAFVSTEISLPEECVFEIQKDENSFSCSLQSGIDGSVFFRTPIEAEKVEKQMLHNIEKGVLIEEDTLFEVATSKDIEGLRHYKIIVHMHKHGKQIHHYEVCDKDNCVGASSIELEFVLSIISQISDKNLYE